ncbi:MAG: hypothetical protein LBF89_09560 [Bacteroidales bacterium]|nr:hypothetical protein [Bacteroidales bacterium]
MKKIAYISVACIMVLVNCSKSDSGAGDSSQGTGGSMARFAIQNDVLYTVSSDMLQLFDLTDAAHPKYMTSKNQKIGSDIETVFPMDTLLFVGSQSGMYVYNVTRPKFPQRLGEVSHIRSCDPVVAQGNYAYVTLNTNENWCGTSPNNVLQIYDISNPMNPKLKKTLNLLGPQGLGVDGNKLFVCDKGLKVYNISQPENPVWVDDLYEIDEADVSAAYDVIPMDGLLILIADEGLYQFDYTGDKLTFVSKIITK